jgi:catechol 2,3-dioxygenase-like lactoylglutathione lyase family enzyme
MLEVGDFQKTTEFYSTLLGIDGRTHPGARAYFDCGEVLLAIVDPTSGGMEPTPNSCDVYFTVNDIEAIHARARDLKCLSNEEIHDQPAGDIVKRPWGELSFYVKDAWLNRLCFVQDGTTYTGR